MKRMRTKGGAVLLLAAAAMLVAGCATRAVESDLGMDDAPDWVNEGTRALADDAGRVFHGVGSAPAMDDRSLQRATADTRARANLAAVLGTYVDAVIEDYTAKAGTGDLGDDQRAVRREIETVTRVNLSGARIIARWRDPDDGTIYSLAELDMDRVQQSVATLESMRPGLREHIREAGDNVFDRISAEER